MDLNLEYVRKASMSQNRFEEDLMLVIKNIDLRNVHDKFQEKLKHDITEIKNSSKVIVPADKACT